MCVEGDVWTFDNRREGGKGPLAVEECAEGYNGRDGRFFIPVAVAMLVEMAMAMAVVVAVAVAREVVLDLALVAKQEASIRNCYDNMLIIFLWLSVVDDAVGLGGAEGCGTIIFGETPQAKMCVTGDIFVGETVRLANEGP